MTELLLTQDRITAPVVEAAPGYVQIEEIDTMRREQAIELNNALKNSDNWQNYGDEEGHQLCAEIIERTLINSGLDKNTEEFRDALKFLQSVSIDSISDYDWLSNSEENGNYIPSAREKTYEEISKKYLSESKNESSTDESGSSKKSNTRTQEEWIEYAKDFEEYASLLTGVEVSRKKWVDVSAKRQGSAIRGKGKKHDDTQNEYHSNVQKLGIMQLEGQIYDQDSDTEKNRKVIEYLFEEQKKLRELTTEKLQGTKIGWFINTMNKGSRKARFAKALGLSAGLGLAGTFIAGAAGVAGVAVATAAASRFVKGYIRGDKHRGMATAEEVFVDSNEPVTLEQTERLTIAERFNAAAKTYNNIFEDDTNKEQNKRKKALLFGLGTVAVGSAIGYGIHQLIDGGQIFHPFGDHDQVPSRPNATVDQSTDPAPAQPPTPADSGYELSDFSDSARYVHSGEGWYETFQDMGIPQEHWADVLKDAGPKLHEQGLAYRDSSTGEWRISHSGNLSLKALKTIAASSKRDGFTLAA